MQGTPWILGISSSHNNGSACLLHGDRIVVAIQEERLTRHKRQGVWGSKPALSIQYCLQHANIQIEDLTLIAVGCQTSTRSVENDVFTNPQLLPAVKHIPILSVSHHLAHAISTYATSGYKEASILVADGMGSPWEDLSPEEQACCGEDRTNMWEAVSLYAASDNVVTPLFKDFVKGGAWISVPDQGMPTFGSLGGMFSAVAHQIFGNLMDAGKVMGLAAYASPSIPSSEFYRLEHEHFIFESSVCARFRDNQRWPNREAEYRTLAASVQDALEKAFFYLVRRLSGGCSFDHLCLSGGVALNSVSIDRICRSGLYKDVYVFPGAEDSGIAVGAAYYGLWSLGGKSAPNRMLKDSCGHEYSKVEIMNAVERTPGIALNNTEDPIEYAANALINGSTVGWFRGGAELGPRALGQRSILFDPRRPDGKDLLNKTVKRRESFRPFAPACLAEEAERWFHVSCGNNAKESPFMTRTVPVRAEAIHLIPGVIHVDGSARIQTVTQANNPALHDLIGRFFARTGIPMLLNTSFNIAGQPLVESPSDALWSMLALSLDILVLDQFIVVKKPSIRSMFDLYPISLSRPMKQVNQGSRRVHNQPAQHESYLSVECVSAWGKFERFFPILVQEILERADGLRSVRDIFGTLAASRRELSEIGMIHLVLELVNASLIILLEPPGTT